MVGYRGYVYLVPSVEEDEYYFLKTIIPSRNPARFARQPDGREDKPKNIFKGE